MKLSVIVPVYNCEMYLKKCLDSIINQTYKNIEIIVVNDGSTDNSYNLIKEYEKKYSKIMKVYDKQNGGQASARNLGLKNAKGDLITFVDSDDYLDENMYSNMINILEKEKSDLVICDLLLYKKNEKSTINSTDFVNLYDASSSVCNKIFKKSLLKDLNFIEGIWYEDYNFFINVCLKKPKYSLCHEPLYIYNVHNDSTMNNNNTIKNLDIITATDDIITKTDNKEMIDTLIINHILLDAVNRVNLQKNKNKKTVSNKLIRYVHEHISNLNNTIRYKNASFKEKLIMKLNYNYFYRITNLLIKLKGREK